VKSLGCKRTGENGWFFKPQVAHTSSCGLPRCQSESHRRRIGENDGTPKLNRGCAGCYSPSSGAATAIAKWPSGTSPALSEQATCCWFGRARKAKGMPRGWWKWGDWPDRNNVPVNSNSQHFLLLCAHVV